MQNKIGDFNACPQTEESGRRSVNYQENEAID